MTRRQILPLVVFLLLPQLAGGVGALFTTPSIPTWYAGLMRSSLNPPSWVFGPVWTILFLLMGIAAFLVWRRGIKKKEVKVALTVFGVQLALNALWSILFFGLRSPGGALIEIFVLWAAILTTLILFWRLSRPAGIPFSHTSPGSRSRFT